MNDENERLIADCYDELNKITKWIKENPIDSNVKFLVSYAVIKASGTIEVVFKSMIHSFLAEDCKKETRVFLEKNIIDASYNASTGNIQKVLENFDSQRPQLFSKELKGSQEKEDLNSLINLRNDIAHGRNISVSINTVVRYFKAGEYIIHHLESIL